jgi:hypothetical protein
VNRIQLNRSRFIVGILLVVVAALMFVFLKGNGYETGAIAIGALGLVSVAISRKR